MITVGDIVYDAETDTECVVVETFVLNDRAMIKIEIPTTTTAFRFPEEVRLIEG